ncbi:phosphoenolpyruvate--protein phosphotransferase [Sansalvadorimonas verongulae]|uniref:phosphoenolpyruvate--protein phosphotransferase n=1 Tax=Sansalvadorimonas verongulae TaxID=2172824 RepID=UPI002E2FC3B7|nr:phosphoenolpyruvate--protein phosphotransferase [Sansalvadorimonas verongulae]
MISSAGHKLVLASPMSGQIVPVPDIPDPVFAEKMMGDGLAIDPTDGVVLSPVDGTVAQFFKTGHALTLRTSDQTDILIHVGLDTVSLQGQGFTPLVKEGDTVEVGQPVLEFDMDYLSRHARSLISPVIITQPEGVRLSGLASGFVSGGKNTLMTVGGDSDGDTAPAIDTSGQPDATADVVIPNPTGLHARPAALLVKHCRSFSGIEVRLACNGVEGPANSVTGIMKLNTHQRDVLTINVWGHDASGAVKALAKAVKEGLGEDVSDFNPNASTAAVLQPDEVSLLHSESDDPNQLKGVKAADGRAVGIIVHMGDINFTYEERGAGADYETSRLDSSLASAHHTLTGLVKGLQDEDKREQSEIFSAHLELLDDPALANAAKESIQQGYSAPAGWNMAVKAEVNALRALDNPVLAGRAADIADIGNRVLAYLTGAAVTTDSWPDNAIPVYKDVSPSDLLSLDLKKVVGIASLEGGASSHAAIISRSLDLPYIAGVDSAVSEVKKGTQVILNADKGFIQLNPSPEDIEHCLSHRQKEEAAYKAALATAAEPAVMTDGIAVEVAANIGSLADAKKAVKLGAEGVGLLRTEFLYMERTTAPTEDEQAQIYTDILKVMGADKPVIIRTLDVGGDKPLSYLPLPEEENPFLGERGIRVGINRPSILKTQIRALLRSARAGKLRVMLPMIGALDEFRVVKQLLDTEAGAIGADVELGIMVEVPSAVLMARELAKEAAFFSIGTNDLTQYTLAIDRGHPRMANRIDGLHPAVLKMIAMTCEGAASENKWTGVCGGLASDLDAVPLLIGLGVNELSVSVPSLPLVKALVRRLDSQRCQELAQKALTAEDGAQVRSLIKTWQEEV